MTLVWIILGLVVLLGFTAFFGAPYVPSKRRELDKAFTELYPLGESDTLVDIGSGDGIVLRRASARGARAVGYELSPILFIVSKILCRNNPLVSVRLGNFYRMQLPPETTVVYTFGDSRDIGKMYTAVQSASASLGRPLWFISYAVAVPGYKAESQVGPHFLYRVLPLQGPGA